VDLRGVLRWTRADRIILLPGKDFDVPAAGWIDFSDIPCVAPANDNMRTKDRLSARCGDLLLRLIAMHGFHRSGRN
jgi:hypothetical protein